MIRVRGELTLFYFTQGGWEGLSDKMAPAVVKEEAGQISGCGLGADRIPSCGEYEVLRQEEFHDFKEECDVQSKRDKCI